MWPSSSLQAPTSDAFLGIVALAPLPRPPRPRPPHPLFPPRPLRPAFVSRPMSSGILGFSFCGILRSSFRARQRVPRTLVRTFLTNERFSRTFLCPRTLSLPANATGSTFLATDGLSTSLVHLLIRPMSSDLIGEMVRLFPTNFYDDSSCPVASTTRLHAYKFGERVGGIRLGQSRCSYSSVDSR
jgi:hypothetical protein